MATRFGIIDETHFSLSWPRCTDETYETLDEALEGAWELLKEGASKVSICTARLVDNDYHVEKETLVEIAINSMEDLTLADLSEWASEEHSDLERLAEAAGPLAALAEGSSK